MDIGGVESEILRANRRLRFAVVALCAAVAGLGTVVALDNLGGGGSGTSGSAITRTGGSSHARGSAGTSHKANGGRSPASVPPPPTLVAVTTGGELEQLDPSTGAPLRMLASGATGDEVAVSPDGRTVYYETAAGCMHEIEEVPITGGSPVAVASGSDPAMSPDGTRIAYARQPFTNSGTCQGQLYSPSFYELVIRQVSTGSETTYPVSPQLANGPARPIDHLSWSSDGQELAVTIAVGQGSSGWQISVVHPATDEYYFGGSGVPVTGNDPSASYYREGVFMRNGDLFVDRVCCQPGTAGTASNLLVEVDPSSGVIVRQLALGILTNDHTSLEADSSGHWLLYISGAQLFVSENGERPALLVTGLSAAAW